MAKKKLKKIRTHSGAAKRIKRTAGGLLKFRRANRSHCNTAMTSMLKRSLRQHGIVGKNNINAVNHLLPY
jgi:large subunit ribosomal protein L35